MLPVQILLILFFLFAVGKVINRYRAHELSSRAAAVWVLFWVLSAVVVVQPNVTSYLALRLGIGRGVDLAVYVALAGLFFMVFRLMVKIEKQSREITKLVREIALRDKNSSLEGGEVGVGQRP